MPISRTQRHHAIPTGTAISLTALPNVITSADKFHRALRSSSERLSDSRAATAESKTREQTQRTRSEQRTDKRLKNTRHYDPEIEVLLQQTGNRQEYGNVSLPFSTQAFQQQTKDALSGKQSDENHARALLTLCHAISERQIHQAIRDGSVTIQLPAHLFSGATLELTRTQNHWHLSSNTQCTSARRQLAMALPELGSRFAESGLGRLTW